MPIKASGSAVLNNGAGLWPLTPSIHNDFTVILVRDFDFTTVRLSFNYNKFQSYTGEEISFTILHA